MKTVRWLVVTSSLLAMMAPAVPVVAQTAAPIESRVNRLEQEMRAVQRKVFPGGTGQVVQPDVTTPPGSSAPLGAPASAPLDDLSARVSAIESQLARMTGQIEQTEFRLRQLEGAFAAAQAKLAPAVTPEPVVPAAPLVQSNPAPVVEPAPAARPAPTTVRPAITRPAAAAGPVASDARLQAVAAIERPSTGDAALDGYTYGYRLWAAKFFPEAQVQLRSVLEKHGSGAMGSRAQNLLGRALLDGGNPAAAAKTLYENYRLRPNGDRAAESLAWVGEALIQLNQLSNACLAYDELDARFGATLPGAVQAMAAKGRARAKCSG
jgi:TolA-binding protein